MECVLVLLLLLGFSANALGQASGGCNATCQTNCGTRFNECNSNYPQDPTAANACSAVQGVWSCLQQKVGPECRTLSDLTVSLQAIESAVSSICDTGRCGSEFSKCYEMFTNNPDIQTCDDISADTNNACKSIQVVWACIQQNLPATCRTGPGLEVSIQSIENATKLYCHPTVTCGQELAKCACRTQRPGALLNQMTDITALCERWPDARTCFDAIPDSCNRNAEARQSIESTRVGYELSYYTACDPKGGVCPATLACFATSIDPQSESGDGDGNDTGAEFKEICRMTLVFDCLDNASRTCNINQGTVTFGQIKGLIMDLCDDVLPHADRMFQCPHFQSCVNDTTLLPPGLQANRIGGQQVTVEDMWKAAHAGVGVTRTGFWCSVLQAVYKCALDNTERCGIQSRDTEPARQQYNRLTSMCVGAATVPPLADRNSGEGPESGAKTRTQSEGPVILLSAILITWLSG